MKIAFAQFAILTFLCIVPTWTFAIFIFDKAGMKTHLAGIKTCCQKDGSCVEVFCLSHAGDGQPGARVPLHKATHTHTTSYTHNFLSFGRHEKHQTSFRKLGSKPRQASWRPSSFQYHRLQEPDRGVPVCCLRGALPQLHYSWHDRKELGNPAHAKQVHSLRTRSACQRSSR